MQVLKAQELKLQLIKDQLQEALESDKDAMSSALIVEGEVMSFEIEELKIRLREREIEVRVMSCHRFKALSYVCTSVEPLMMKPPKMGNITVGTGICT